jgi:aryl-alcohol dehydrogenase-like predicted oxidoreductase
MRYRRLASSDVSEIALSAEACSRIGDDQLDALFSEAFRQGVNLFWTLSAEETAAVGRTLSRLGSRRNAIITAGVEEFFAAFSRHDMRLDDFLEHELSDRLERLQSKYLDCFVIDLGRGRSVDLEAVRAEPISSGGNGRAVKLETFEGGAFLHETIDDCLRVIERFMNEGRVRMAGLSGENIDALTRVLVKHPDFEVVFAPYNYGFRTTAAELIPVAEETATAVVATRPLWWGPRSIPVTVLSESPYPARADVTIKPDVLASTACKWPLRESAVSSVVVSPAGPSMLSKLTTASGASQWTRADEDILRPVGRTAEVEGGVLLALSAMNSGLEDVRIVGWAALQRMHGKAAEAFDPHAPVDERTDALAGIAAEVVPDEPVPADDEDLDDLM